MSDSASLALIQLQPAAPSRKSDVTERSSRNDTSARQESQADETSTTGGSAFAALLNAIRAESQPAGQVAGQVPGQVAGNTGDQVSAEADAEGQTGEMLIPTGNPANQAPIQWVTLDAAATLIPTAAVDTNAGTSNAGAGTIIDPSGSIDFGIREQTATVGDAEQQAKAPVPGDNGAPELPPPTNTNSTDPSAVDQAAQPQTPAKTGKAAQVPPINANAAKPEAPAQPTVIADKAGQRPTASTADVAKAETGNSAAAQAGVASTDTTAVFPPAQTGDEADQPAVLQGQITEIENLLKGRTLRAWHSGGPASSSAATSAGNGQVSQFSGSNPATGSTSSTFDASADTGGASGGAGPTSQSTVPAAAGGNLQVGELAQHGGHAPAKEAATSSSAPLSTNTAGGEVSMMGESTPSIDTATTTSTSQPGHRADAPRIPAAHLSMMAATMARRLENGNREFTMRLDPAELGQVDVKLEMLPGRKVRAVISAEKPEGLAELQRSARDLERALNDAGLDLSEEGISFSLDAGAGDSKQGKSEQEAQSARFDASSSLQNSVQAEQQDQTQPVVRAHANHEIWKRARVSISA
jgi:flagellar hook-length control protein FliK